MKHLTDIQKIEAADLLHSEENPHAEHLGSCRLCYEEVLSMSIADHHNTENPGKQPPAGFSEQFTGDAGGKAPQKNPAPGWLKWAGGIAAVAVVASGLYLAFLPDKPAPVKSAAFITFVKGKVQVNGQAAVTGTRLVKGDTITTGKSSVATVQFNNQAVATLEPKTEITIGKFTMDGSRPDITIQQRQGKAFHKIRKKSADYKVETLTLVAAVRGTMFEIDAGKTGTVVSMHEGVVTASPQGKSGDTGETKLTKNQKLVHSAKDGGAGKLTVRKLKKAERKRLEALSKIAIVHLKPEDLALSKKDGKLPPEVLQRVADQTVVTGAAEVQILGQGGAKKVVTLDDLKKKHGQLSKIMLKNGKEYIGVFKMQDNMLRITTVNGSFKVPGENVSKIVPYE